MPLAEPALFVFRLGLLLAANGEGPICQFDLDILLIETWQLGGDLDVFIGLAHFNVRPPHRSIRAERRYIEAAKYIIEQPVHFAVQSEERTVLGPASAHLASAITPRNEILHCHGYSPF